MFDIPAHKKFLEQESQLTDYAKELMRAYKKNSEHKIRNGRGGLTEFDEFYPKLSKPILDEIDCVLAQHYGFTEEELDFIVNYDIKYRLGADASGEED
jgi:hypothetical protein